MSSACGRRHILAAILSAVNSLLCPEMDRNIRFGKQGYVFILPILRSVSFLTSTISVSTVVFTLQKVECFKSINLRNSLFIGFVKFEIKQWFLAYQDQFSAWFSLARLPTETAREFFSGSFSKRNGFIVLLLASRTCSMSRQDIFVPYLLPSHVKYYPNSQNFPPF